MRGVANSRGEVSLSFLSLSPISRVFYGAKHALTQVQGVVHVAKYSIARNLRAMLNTLSRKVPLVNVPVDLSTPSIIDCLAPRSDVT